MVVYDAVNNIEADMIEIANDMSHYAVVQTTCRGGSAPKVENVWMIIIKPDQMERFQELLSMISTVTSNGDVHKFDLVKIKRGPLTKVYEDMMEAATH